MRMHQFAGRWNYTLIYVYSWIQYTFSYDPEWPWKMTFKTLRLHQSFSVFSTQSTDFYISRRSQLKGSTVKTINKTGSVSCWMRWLNGCSILPGTQNNFLFSDRAPHPSANRAESYLPEHPFLFLTSNSHSFTSLCLEAICVKKAYEVLLHDIWQGGSK